MSSKADVAVRDAAENLLIGMQMGWDIDAMVKVLRDALGAHPQSSFYAVKQAEAKLSL